MYIFFLFWNRHFRAFTCFSICELFLERGPAALALVQREHMPTPWARVSSKCDRNKTPKCSWANGEAHAQLRNRRVKKLRLAICIYHSWNLGGQFNIFRRIQICIKSRPFFSLFFAHEIGIIAISWKYNDVTDVGFEILAWVVKCLQKYKQKDNFSLFRCLCLGHSSVFLFFFTLTFENTEKWAVAVVDNQFRKQKVGVVLCLVNKNGNANVLGQGVLKSREIK